MKEIFYWLNESKYTKPLSKACKMCAQGSKMVVLITGLCPANCFYCPLSLEKHNKDRIFADEWELENENDIEKLISEAKYINARGAGITGGDPLIVWDRTEKYIKILKENFGSRFHIHLYTSGLKNAKYIARLEKAGLDEIRFHPEPRYWDKLEKSKIKNTIINSTKSSMDVALEIPVFPDKKEKIISLISWADKNNLDFINLNELEFSESNADSLISKRYDVKDDISSAVKDSERIANEILENFSKNDFKVGIHYCSSSFKDGIQLRNRIKRRAKNIKKFHETISEDGTIIIGIIENQDNIYELYKNLKQKYKLRDKIFFNKEKNRIETTKKIIKRIAKKEKLNCYIVEEYPTADRLEVERIPL